MALRIRLQQSTDYGTLGAGATWTQFDDIADPGGGFTSTFNTPVLGTGYWIRAQRYDDVTLATSAWSAIVYILATLPVGAAMTTMIDPCSIRTSSDLEFGVAFEPHYGVPTKARWKARSTGGFINIQRQRRRATARGSNTAMYSSAKPGRYTFEGEVQFVLSPERAFPTLLGTQLKVGATDTLAAPARYRHHFQNFRTCQSITVCMRLSATEVLVCPGAIVTRSTWNLSEEGEEALTVGMNITATDCFVVNHATTALSQTGMDTAVYDLLDEYVSDDFALSVGGKSSAAKSFSMSIESTVEPIKQPGWRAPVGYYTKRVGVTISGEGYFEGIDSIAREYGYSSTPVGNFGATCELTQVAVSIKASPCVNASAYSNELEISVPSADVQLTFGADGDDFTQSFVATAIWDSSNALGTDSEITVINSHTRALLVQPGISMSPLDVPRSNSRPYIFDIVGAAATTTVVPLASINNIYPGAGHLAPVDNDYTGKTLRVIDATGAVQNGLILSYTAPTGVAAGSFTLAAALATAPVAGDTVVVL